MLYSNVFGNGVAAPRAAAQRKRRSELKVIQIADTAERRRGVDDKTAGLHSVRELEQLLSLRGIDPQYGGVT